MTPTDGSSLTTQRAETLATEIARAIIASDWMKRHDADVAAKAVQAVAQAIDAEGARDVYQQPIGLDSEACYFEGARDAYENAARIARGGTS